MKLCVFTAGLAALLLSSCIESSTGMNRFEAQIVYGESESITGTASRLEIDRGGRAMLWRGVGPTLMFVGQLYLLDYELEQLEDLLVSFYEKSPQYGPDAADPDVIARTLEVSTTDWHHEVKINLVPEGLPADLVELIGELMEISKEIEEDHQ